MELGPPNPYREEEEEEDRSAAILGDAVVIEDDAATTDLHTASMSDDIDDIQSDKILLLLVELELMNDDNDTVVDDVFDAPETILLRSREPPPHVGDKIELVESSLGRGES